MENPPPFDQDEMNILEQFADTDDTKWTWPDAGKKRWVLGDVRDFREFYKNWANKPTDFKFPSTFPYKLSLGSNSGPLASFRSSWRRRILVTQAYDDMFHRLLRLRMNDSVRNRGAVITGQSGIGKTVFLRYMLARLIHARQVVLWYDNYWAHLFFRGQVYTRMGAEGFCDLPKLQGSDCPVWALIDMDYRTEQPPLSRSTAYWPIQASPPDRIRWKSWAKQNNAFLLGMPLRDIEELTEGLSLYHGYDSLRRELEQSLSLPDGSTPPVVSDRNVRAAVKAFQGGRNCDWMGYGTEAVADQDENMIDEAGQLQKKVDKVIKILVRNTTEEFGLAPREVYEGIFDYSLTSSLHADARRLFDHSRLETIVETFLLNHEVNDFSERVVAVQPRPFLTGHDRWTIDFKSVQIGREVMESMRLRNGKHLPQLYEYTSAG